MCEINTQKSISNKPTIYVATNLHESFKTNEDADILMKFFWTKEKEERDKNSIGIGV